MTRLQISLVLVLLASLFIDLACSDSEVQGSNCPVDCPSNYCPKSKDEDQSSCSLEGCPTPASKCPFNHRRAENGTCIPTRNCPPFDCSNKPNEEYNPCPPLCPSDSCTQATPDGRCPKYFGIIGIVLICNPTCRCITGYWRNNEGNCIPYSDCPK